MQIWCRFPPRCVNREFIVPASQKNNNNNKKKNRMGAWNSMFILIAVFSMACKKANKVDSATSLTQLHKVPRFLTIYFQLFHAVKTIFVHLVQKKEKKNC